MPPEPMTSAPRQSRTAKLAFTAARTARRSSTTLRGRGPPRRYSSVTRMAPKGSEMRCSSSPSALSASSSDPPPMSMTTARPAPISKCASALRKLRRASSSPSSRRTLSPASSRTRRRNASPLRASRTALVATASTRAQPSCRASVAIRCSASSAARIPLSASSPVSCTPAPRRGAAFISSTTRMAPRLPTSATIWRMELEPMSMAAMRIAPPASPFPCAGAGATPSTPSAPSAGAAAPAPRRGA